MAINIPYFFFSILILLNIKPTYCGMTKKAAKIGTRIIKNPFPKDELKISLNEIINIDKNNIIILIENNEHTHTLLKKKLFFTFFCLYL